MQVPEHAVPGIAASALLLGAFIIAIGAIGASEQDPVFSEARAYERFMGRWSRRLAPLFVRFAGVSDGDGVLDVGSGTGALTAAVAEAAPSSRVVGIDPAAAVSRLFTLILNSQICPSD